VLEKKLDKLYENYEANRLSQAFSLSKSMKSLAKSTTSFFSLKKKTKAPPSILGDDEEGLK